MTDDSEVREGDVREFRGVVQWVTSTRSAEMKFDGAGHLTTTMNAEELAASRLISRKAPEIKVGSRVEHKTGWAGCAFTVCGLNSAGTFALLEDAEGWCVMEKTADLTLVEDPTDG